MLGLTKSHSNLHNDRSSAPASLGSPHDPTVVERVMKGSAAAASGLDTGDTLLSIVVDSKDVSTTGMSLKQILMMLKNRPKNSPTTLVFRVAPRSQGSPELSPLTMTRGNLKRIALGPGPLGMGLTKSPTKSPPYTDRSSAPAALGPGSSLQDSPTVVQRVLHGSAAANGGEHSSHICVEIRKERNQKRKKLKAETKIT